LNSASECLLDWGAISQENNPMKNTAGHNHNQGRDFSQVQVINRAVSILRAIRDSGGLNLSQLARKVGLARSTVHRIVATLEAEDLLTTVSADGRIQLGMELMSLGAAVKSDFRREMRPYLEGLSINIDETVDLSLMENNRLIFLDQVARLRRLRAVSGLGVTFPLHCTANGKALLADLPLEEVESLLPETLEAWTIHSIVTRAELVQELQLVRAEGVAYDREEHTIGICAVGAAIHGPMGSLAAISIPVPSVRFYGNEERLKIALLETCELVNRRFEGM
jgi:DNA-binding IclR family transcriptional regulator